MQFIPTLYAGLSNSNAAKIHGLGCRGVCQYDLQWRRLSIDPLLVIDTVLIP